MTSQEQLLLSNGDSTGSRSNKFVIVTLSAWKKNWLLFAGLTLGFCLFYILSQLSITETFSFRFFNYAVQNPKYSVWPEFELTPPIDDVYFRSQCAKNGKYSVTGLSDIKKEWAKSRNFLCQTLYDKFTSIFTLEARKATHNIPAPLRIKVLGWLANNNDLYKEALDQDVVHIVSEYTREHTVFNPLRDKRPVLPPEQSEESYFSDIMNSSAKNCDFCRFKSFTAEHTFGRVESKHAFSASNIFKIDTLHALLVLKKHDPLHWSLEEFLDLFQLTETWLAKAHSNNPKARYPAVIWDTLPKCGASQVHPHMHVVLDFERYHGEMEAWRKGAQDYFVAHSANYFSDLVAIYAALNLTVTYGKAVAFASLVPRKDHEVVIIAEKPNTDFYTLLYFVLRAFIDDLHKMCFSMGVGLPAIDVPEGSLPAYARVITRGYVTDLRTDISSLELFMATNVNIDPYKTIEIVRRSVEHRSEEAQLKH
ncbi:unnamed protein product [Candidula unifasciata]|uniref:Uncharacterized protein n=1 Tax=Candidula unifasciata TaxID=100452 RepID=A0A8S3Z033_9EUPU|nr:unnamed protein product [Candidula unifasciata]